MGLSHFLVDYTKTNPSNDSSQMLINLYGDSENKYYSLRPTFSLRAAAGFTMTDRKTPSTGNNHVALVSFPMYARISKSAFEDIYLERLFITMKEGTDKYDTGNLTADLQLSFGGGSSQVRVWDDTEEADTYELIERIINIIFNVIIAITMFLCFFSLSSSMSANLLEQTKELGVLRAIGLTKYRVIMLYIYEAFILVTSSSLLGVLIGTIVGFTLTL